MFQNAIALLRSKLFSPIFKTILLLVGVSLLFGCSSDMPFGFLKPNGVTAFEERQLFFDSLALMLIVVIPVIIMSFAFVFRYRRTHHAKDYKPNWSHSVFLETIWWGIPCAIIIILGVMTWKSTHKLDPFQPIGNKPVDLRIQVVALPWKWLFIYPDQKIATLNYLEVPKGKQVLFIMTNDNVAMSAFFIPELGSQIYTMAGMRTKLHVLPTFVGTYRGLNTQYNGEGFSDMHFPVHVVSDEEMAAWVKQVKKSSDKLTNDEYQEIRKPSIAAPAKFYSVAPINLFDNVLNYYMTAKPGDKLVIETTSPEVNKHAK
ncbi:MAG: COX aromatic rich motif-containing protein [Gammaproteobacteria bacterium]